MQITTIEWFFLFFSLFFRQVDGTAPTFVTKPSIRQKADDTTTLVFHCSIYADPKPVVTWFHNGDKVQDNKKFQVCIFFLFAQNLLWFNTLLAAIYQQRNLRKLEPKGRLSSQAFSQTHFNRIRFFSIFH